MINPYQPPSYEEEKKKYKEPLINWKLFLYITIVTSTSFCIVILLQVLIRSF